MKTKDVPFFGFALARARAEAGLTADGLAKLAGMQEPNIHRVENGYRSVSWASAYRLIVCGGLDLSFFFPADLVLRSANRLRMRDRNPQPAP